MRKVPELSLADYQLGAPQEKKCFINDLLQGFKEYGFIILKDHPVSDDLLERSYTSVEKFLSLPEETKLQYVCPQGGGQRGYTGFGKEHAKDSQHPDLKEFWHVGRELPEGHRFRQFCPENIWPTEIPEFKRDLRELYQALDETSVLILDALGEGLDLPREYFREMVHLGNSILRPICYPPLPEKGFEKSLRSAPHEDINLITLLVAATDSGLELLDRDGRWLPVEPPPGSIIVDSGDMLSRLTNDVIPATTHRVVNSQDPTRTRYSMPFFVHPHPEAMLTCLPSCVGQGEKYPPILSHDFLMQRIHEIGLMG